MLGPNVTTEETWVAQGLTLNTYAFNISTLGGTRLSPPPLRGSDLEVPYRHGQVALPRYVGPQTITLGMWVQGTQRDGSAPPIGTSNYLQFIKNFRTLRKALWSVNEYDLTKTFYNNDLELVTATAKARFAGGLQPSMQGRAHGTFTVDLLLANPFFYAPVKTHNATVGASSVELAGDFSTTNIEIVFSGAATIKNLTNDVSITTTGACTVQVMDGIVSSGVQVTHSGSPQLFVLNDGVNSLQVTGASATIKYREAYF